MSLLTDEYEPFNFINKTRVLDGYGGYISQWTKGPEFMATANFPQSSMGVIADKLTETVNCTITTSRAVTLDAMEIVQRQSDGVYFRILQDGSFNKTPKSAGLDMRQSRAEVLTALPDKGE